MSDALRRVSGQRKMTVQLELGLFSQHIRDNSKFVLRVGRRSEHEPVVKSIGIDTDDFCVEACKQAIVWRGHWIGLLGQFAFDGLVYMHQTVETPNDTRRKIWDVR